MMSSYKPSRQPLIVIACCTLHNFICKWTQNDVMFTQREEEELEFEDKDGCYNRNKSCNEFIK